MSIINRIQNLRLKYKDLRKKADLIKPPIIIRLVSIAIGLFVAISAAILWWPIVVFAPAIYAYFFSAVVAIIPFLYAQGWWGLFLEWLGSTFRRLPVLTSFIMFCLGGFIYAGFYLCVFEPYHSSKWLPSEINWTMIVSIIFAPYFYLLWVWRHNNNEQDKRRNHQLDERTHKLDEMAEFNAIIGHLQSNETAIKIYAVESLETFIGAFRNDKVKYLNYIDRAISILTQLSVRNNKRAFEVVNRFQLEYKMCNKNQPHKDHNILSYGIPCPAFYACEASVICNSKISLDTHIYGYKGKFENCHFFIEIPERFSETMLFNHRNPPATNDDIISRGENTNEDKTYDTLLWLKEFAAKKVFSECTLSLEGCVDFAETINEALINSDIKLPPSKVSNS